jgi:hypothetical protein
LNTRRGSSLQPSGVQELFNRDANILADLAKKHRRDVSSRMEGDSRGPSVRVPKLLVGSALPYLLEPEGLELADNFSWLEDGDLPHSGDLDCLRADEFALKGRLAVLEEHFDDFPQVIPELVEGRSLRMGSRETRHKPDVKPGLRIPLYYRRKRLHVTHQD